MAVKKPESTASTQAPEITQEQMNRLRALVLSHSKEPLLPAGTITKCPGCGGEMVTTNDLEKVVPTPNGIRIISRLPGARCGRCALIQYDSAALRLILEHSSMEIVADYETKVTRASGQTLGTYFRADLTRVLALTGKERLGWKVLDRNHVLVEIAREPTARRPAPREALKGRTLSTKRPDPKRRPVRGSLKPA